MNEAKWMAVFEKELSRAEAARTAGNEGRARVCARRAAGLLAYEILKRDGIEPRGNSVLDYLEQMQSDMLLDEETRAPPPPNFFYASMNRRTCLARSICLPRRVGYTGIFFEEC